MRQLLAEIDSAELTEWFAYYTLEPFGELIADQRHGIATSVLANINRDPRRKKDAYKPSDFIYWHEANRIKENPLPQDPEARAEAMITAMFGGNVTRADK